MAMNLTCSQVIALLSFYINDKVSGQIKSFISSHLEVCPICRQKYEALKSMIGDLRNAQESINLMEQRHVPTVPISDYSKAFTANLSAYVDNELSDDENIKFKKYAISNQPIRHELESIYSVKNMLNSSFEKTKNEFKDDFTKYVMIKMNMQDEIYAREPLLKVATIFILLLVFFTVSAIMFFWV